MEWLVEHQTTIQGTFIFLVILASAVVSALRYIAGLLLVPIGLVIMVTLVDRLIAGSWDLEIFVVYGVALMFFITVENLVFYNRGQNN